MLHIRNGLDIPLSGSPRMQVEDAPLVRHVALLGRDYLEMRPTLLVSEGDQVALGKPLFSDKKNPRVLYTAPAAGRVVAINRGERRVFESLVIELSGSDEEFFPFIDLGQLKSEQVEELLLKSGLWPAFRTRPYTKVPAPETRPAAIFVTAIDTNPLAADPQVVISLRAKEFSTGLKVIRHLTDGKVHLCKEPTAKLPSLAGISVQDFFGRHPAGLVGTHIHYLEKVNQQRSVWHIGYQDVIAIGHLFLTGRLLSERIVALCGPGVKNPRLLRTRLGSCLSELTAGEVKDKTVRVISGSVLAGYKAAGAEDFLGRYHNQISVLVEDKQRQLLGWAMPGSDKFSLKRVFASAILPRRPLPLTTNINGSLRAMVPIGAYEKVLPLNVKATWLLRSLLTLDTDLAQKLGCLELDEEDLALCSFVCPGKIDYGKHLRETLQRIEKEG
ncbi:Na(+)-translocating NADH-quinone reductase subunit A [Malonomonas rubra]|uniref:Na(+)-translocating NADH-quinone reductase subunit A n=1 Tax=Malonomonas rubra TaxID=57040 RepID=UPI0026ECC01A|nr:Na(+)-translocating NADH-quinone reductase subunit A [Malonomonas rubra]